MVFTLLLRGSLEGEGGSKDENESRSSSISGDVRPSNDGVTRGIDTLRPSRASLRSLHS